MKKRSELVFGIAYIETGVDDICFQVVNADGTDWDEEETKREYNKWRTDLVLFEHEMRTLGLEN